MPPAPVRRRKRARGADGAEEPTKREAILDAALALFSERGFHGTAVPLVAEAANVGAGTIYRYFENKEALVNALYQREKQAMLTSIFEDLPQTSGAQEQFRIFFYRLAEHAKRRPLAMRFLELHHHAAYLDDTSRALEAHAYATIEMAFRAGVEQLVIKDLPTELLYAVVLGVFGGLLRSWTEGRIALDEPTLAAAERCCWEAIRR